MKGIKLMKNLVKTMIASGILAVLASCSVGLGNAVDMQPPTVNVISPERSGYILQDFLIKGTAKDNIAVDQLTVTIEPLDNPTQANSFFYRIKNHKWEVFDVASQTWGEYNNTYSTINGPAKSFEWNLSLQVDSSVVSGTEYNIITQVYDANNNESKNSKDERAVTIDTVVPVVSVTAPSLRTYAAETSANASYTLKDNSVLDNLMNGTFKIKGSQKEDARLDYMYIYLDTETTSPVLDQTALNQIAQSCLLKKKVEGVNLRNWEAEVNLSTIAGIEHNKTTIRLITESHDQAGNVEGKVQGFFTYWNDADIPWVTASFGGDAYTDDVGVYPNCALQGQSYDDDGIKKLEVRIYKGNETTPVKTQVYDLADENYPRYKAWSVNALGDNCQFRVEAFCTDINGKVSETVKRYMTVTDTNPPAITITTDTTVPMTGDASGNITISGFATDDGGVSKVKLLRVKSGTNSTTLVQYYNNNYSEWNKATANGAVDANGNKIWDLTSTLTAEVSGDATHKKSFSKTFNIFNDFGINGSTEKLTTQNFIIMATDTGNIAKIDSFTFAGDAEVPSLHITEVHVKKSNGTEKESINFNTGEAHDHKLTPYNRDSNGNITDKIIIQGTWSDNSTNDWTDKSRHGNVTINLEGSPTTISVTVKNDGTWITNQITPADTTTAVIYAEFADYAGNVAKTNENFFVNSTDPEFLRISAENPDGSYKAGDTIVITLEFNKAVQYSGGGTPMLTLNNTSRTISCTTNSNTPQFTHKFTYKPAVGEDIAVLDVTAIDLKGNKYTADGTEVKNIAIPSGANAINKLSGTRTICIDTKEPQISKITAISPSGYYRAGKDIFISLEFTEDVTIKDPTCLKLRLSNGAVVTNPKVTSPKTVLFTYEIASTDTSTTTLKVTSVDSEPVNAANKIVDIAGNALVNSGFTKDLSGLIIDTLTPATPVISGITEGEMVYDNSGKSFSINWGTNSDAVIKKYSVDGGKSWTDYTGSSVTISNNGDYTVTAYQQDAAGNRSENATVKHFSIDAGAILTSVTAGVPTGIYTTGKAIPIYLNFRKDVTVTSGTLTLSNGKTATYTSGSGTKQAVFTYTVAEGDSSSALNVTTINGTYKDSKGNNVDNYVKAIPSGKNLSDSRIIQIVTGKPVIQSIALSKLNGNDVLTIIFSSSVKKGSGNITLEHGTGFKAPSVISEETFIKWLAKEDTLDDYYTLGTNGSDVNGNSDLTEKYVLDYDIETNNTSLISALKNADADKVIISVNNSNVAVSGNKVAITLSDTYAVPVKGASYSVIVDAGIVKDSQNHANELSNTYTVTHSGLEAPVVRVNKKRETTGTTVTQPLQTGVKADCQTPGATVTCVVYRQVNSQYSVTGKNSIPTKAALNLTQQSTQSTYPFNIGDGTNTTNGYIYRINATATKDSATVTAYEFAYRSVYAMTNIGGGEVGTTGNYAQVWVRGSDLPSGGLSLSTFPVSWNSTEFDKVRAMTNSTGNTWYWVSWEINKPAYLEPLRGDMPSDAATKGPSVWSWGMQCYIPGLANHPLYPGQSITFNGNTNYYGANSLSFYNKHCEYRNGNSVVKKKK